ncbi:MAG: hypothetical protein QXX32_02580 [Thermofilum sp.]|uniref:hypothetical protein n=1 Tax=Thermofilum sp. TaxID=1961369 RepID=UPI003162425F
MTEERIAGPKPNTAPPKENGGNTSKTSLGKLAPGKSWGTICRIPAKLKKTSHTAVWTPLKNKLLVYFPPRDPAI